jgi:hypothetical protein
MMEAEVKTAIDSKELKRLQIAAAKLAALDAGDVDNWEWYDESLKDFRATIQREEDLESLLDELCVILFTSAYEPSDRGTGFACTETAKADALKLLHERIAKLKDDQRPPPTCGPSATRSTTSAARAANHGSPVSSAGTTAPYGAS